jgi:hypothetical protein
MEHVIILLLIILLICIGLTSEIEAKNETKTDSKRIIPTVDIQFSEQNFPSVVYEDIFSGPNIWQGGYNLDQGRPIAKGPQGQQRSPPPPSGYVKSG